jgi:hypothetical protein
MKFYDACSGWSWSRKRRVTTRWGSTGTLSFCPCAFPQRTIQTPLERAASLFPSLVEPAIERPRPRAPPFVIPINDRWMASEPQTQPAGPPSELVPSPPLRRSDPEVFRNDPSSSANPLSPHVPGCDEPHSRSIHGGAPLFSEQWHSYPIHSALDSSDDSEQELPHGPFLVDFDGSTGHIFEPSRWCEESRSRPTRRHRIPPGRSWP